MFDTLFMRHVTPLNGPMVSQLRIWLRTSPLVPAPPYAGAVPPTAEQSLLLLSLTYGAGVKPDELARMRVDALLDDAGSPDKCVRIRPETTRHYVSRKVEMHPDIRRDVLAFRERHPTEQFVAFIPLFGDMSRQLPMSEHGLTQWFQNVFRNAGLDGVRVSSGRKMFNANQRRN